LTFVAGGKPSGSFVLWVHNYDRVVYQSPSWPAGISPESLPRTDRFESGYEPRPGQPPPPPPRRGEEISPRNPALPRTVAQFHTRESDGRTWRIGVMGNPYVTLIVAADIGEFNGGMIALRNRFLAALPVVLALAAAGAWFVAGRALRPITALTDTARRVTARGLDERIPAMALDREFNQLITVFNEMLDRLEKSFLQATRFSADASHELKTPLARLRAELEQALADAPAGSPQQATFGSLLDDVSHLNAVSQKLLLLSLADAGRLQPHCEPVDLTRMLENVIEDTQAQAPGLTVEHALAPRVIVSADAHLLEQVLQNLSSNAIKYNQPAGRIIFQLTSQADGARLVVANTGPGITPAERARVFERFYRTDQSRNSCVGGVGLGLSLAREIVRAHGGTITLCNTADGLTAFTLTLATHPQINKPSTAQPG
jgi:signal transduction histidine kinase